MRHGSRNPSTKQVKKSKHFLEQVLKHLNKENKKKQNVFDEIQITFENTEDRGLTELGARELYGIGKRFRDRYPTLFTQFEEDIKSKKLDIASSSKNRSIESGKNFLYGLYENYTNNHDQASLYDQFQKLIYLNDYMMRMFDQCKAYVRGVKNNANAINEYLKFKAGHEMNELVERIKKRFNIETLSEEVINPSKYIK